MRKVAAPETFRCRLREEESIPLLSGRKYAFTISISNQGSRIDASMLAIALRAATMSN